MFQEENAAPNDVPNPVVNNPAPSNAIPNNPHNYPVVLNRNLGFSKPIGAGAGITASLTPGPSNAVPSSAVPNNPVVNNDNNDSTIASNTNSNSNEKTNILESVRNVFKKILNWFYFPKDTNNVISQTTPPLEQEIATAIKSIPTELHPLVTSKLGTPAVSQIELTTATKSIPVLGIELYPAAKSVPLSFVEQEIVTAIKSGPTDLHPLITSKLGSPTLSEIELTTASKSGSVDSHPFMTSKLGTPTVSQIELTTTSKSGPVDSHPFMISKSGTSICQTETKSEAVSITQQILIEKSSISITNMTYNEKVNESSRISDNFRKIIFREINEKNSNKTNLQIVDNIVNKNLEFLSPDLFLIKHIKYNLQCVAQSIPDLSPLQRESLKQVISNLQQIQANNGIINRSFDQEGEEILRENFIHLKEPENNAQLAKRIIDELTERIKIEINFKRITNTKDNFIKEIVKEYVKDHFISDIYKLPPGEKLKNDDVGKHMLIILNQMLTDKKQSVMSQEILIHMNINLLLTNKATMESKVSDFYINDNNMYNKMYSVQKR